jgi:hypothetical protein
VKAFEMVSSLSGYYFLFINVVRCLAIPLTDNVISGMLDHWINGCTDVHMYCLNLLDVEILDRANSRKESRMSKVYRLN